MTSIAAPPANTDAERIVLGAAILDSGIFWPAIQDLQPLAFSVASHRIVYGAMHAIHSEGRVIDRITVLDALKQRGELAEAGGISYVMELDNGIPRFPNIDQYIAILHREARRREIYQQAWDLHVEASKPSSSLQDVEDALARLRDGAEVYSPSSLLTVGEAIEREGGAQALLGGDRRKIIPTPFLSLDNALAGGWRAGQLVVIGGRPGNGKTVLGLQIALAAAARDFQTQVFSLEMTTGELLIRAACSQTGVPIQRVRENLIDKAERAHLAKALLELSKQPLRVSDKSFCTPANLNAAIRYQRAKNGVDLVVVDYLGLMSAGVNHDNRTAEISYITRQLKLAAKDLGLCLVLLAQLNRGNVKDKRPPTLHDLRDSGSIEQDADIVLFPNPLADGAGVDLIVAKQRNGWTGRIPLAFDGACVRFVEDVRSGGSWAK